MRNRLFRFTPQGSGIALAATAVALMSFHGQAPAGNGAAGSSSPQAATHGIGQAPKAQPGVMQGLTRVEFWPDMYHQPPR